MKHRYLKDVTTLSYKSEKCVGCGRCTEVCPHGVFEVGRVQQRGNSLPPCCPTDINDKKAYITDKDLCMECGACVLNCPVKAIEVNAGVGCALAIIKGWITGGEPSCDCMGGSSGGCC